MKKLKRKLTVPLLFLFVASLLLVFNFSVPPTKAILGSEDIIFEYGAEGGTDGEKPQPPFSPAGPSGSGDHTGYAKINDEKARTGTKSVKLYQPPPTKVDGDRRIMLTRKYGNEHEMYVSWWAWYPDEIVNNQYGYRNLGGVKIRYELPNAEDDSDRARNGFAIHVRADDEIYMKVYNLYCPVQGASSGSLGTKGRYTEVNSGVYLNSTYRNTWIQIQCYIKVSNNTDGAYKLWLNGNSLVSVTGYKTDARSDGDWASENWSFQFSSDGTPYVDQLIYNKKTEPEVWCWVDDIVFSREEVPNTYGVGGQASEWEGFEDGFEGNNFSAWNSTQQGGGGVAPSVTSSLAYAGTYSETDQSSQANEAYASNLVLNVKKG